MYRQALPILAVTIAVCLTAPANAGAVLDRIRQTGVLLMAEPDLWPPYVIRNDKGEFDGFDVEVFREIARRMGVEAKYVRNPDGTVITWEEQTSGQWGGKYDIVVNSMTPTAKRAEHIEFPAVYYYGLGALAVHRDNTTIRIPADASGKRIGALKTSIYEIYLRREPMGIAGMPPISYKINDPVIVGYPHEEDVFVALAKGDGVARDEIMALHWLTLAARDGLAAAEEVRIELMQRMSVEDIAAAERRARAWRPTSLRHATRRICVRTN